MGKRVGRRMKRAVTILMAALLVVGTVNCASMTAKADEGAANEKTVISEVSDAFRKELGEPVKNEVPEIDDNNNSGEGAAEVVDIEEEETPLAGAHCWIHWLILILTAAYTIYEVIRSIARNKRIKELEEQHETIEA